MEKINYKMLKCRQNFRQILVLATLSSTPILIEDIHGDKLIPGLQPHEISLLRLIESISDGCFIEINETGQKLKYKPGIVIGGRHLVHNCGVSRSIGYFLEPLLVLGLFGKKPLSITLQGITNDSKDPSVDAFIYAALPVLKRFGIPSEGLQLKIKRTGVPPGGGGEVVLSVPTTQSLTAINWIEEGMVKRIRGCSFSARVSSQFENSMIYAARGIFNRLLPDVHIFTNHRAGPEAGNSPGYGISLVAETTSGCFISADTAVFYSHGGDDDELEDEKKDLARPEDVGLRAAAVLLEEVKQGGVVDSSHQGLLFLLCALCPPDVCKVRVGKLSPYGIETLREIKDFLGVKFVIKPDSSTGTVILKCVGSGTKNLSRIIS